MRRLVYLLSLAALLGGGTAAYAAFGVSDVTLTTSTLPTLRPGQTAWVSTLWTGAPVDATSFTLRATAPSGITISYPSNTGSYSSLYKQSTLLAADTDYAALKVAVGPNVIGNQTITLAVAYTLGESRSGGSYGGSSSGRSTPVTKNLTVTLPVVAATGPAAQLVTTSVGPIKSGAAQYVQISYKGVKPGLTGVAVTVTSKPAGLTVTYPGDRSSSSLSQDSTLDVDETDSAAVRLDTGTLAPGSYPLGVDFAYGANQHVTGTVTLVVG
jgi:hypothetical protein